MPKISEFFGIVIAMFYNDHNPPHFHAIYGDYKAIISIKNLALINGKLPPRALSLVIEWASTHQDALLNDWNLAAKHQQLKKIEPLL